MMEHTTYQNYFDIDPKYYAAVTADLIRSGKVKWNAFYPHESFINLLEKTHTMLSGKDSRSLWVEGAYGTGKSHAALTVKSMLEASDEEIRAYFHEFGLREDLCEQLITDKNHGRLITIHRIGSAAIHSDQDLILALQDSITAALRAHGIENRGEASLRDAALRWFTEKDANRVYFDSLIQEDKYMWDFGGRHVEEVIDVLQNAGDERAISKMMRNILRVAEDNGITALRLDIPAMCEWIKSVLEQNDISAILFVWDEFSEYFINNANSLTGFQSLVEISESHPFYFLIVTHETTQLDQYLIKDMRKKILNRFISDKTVVIEMPENMAFRLMAQAMRETDDAVLKPQWLEYKADLNDVLNEARTAIISHARKTATMGQKTVLSDAELRGVVPIHPYAALVLKHMSVAFNSNARSMFDFIISNDMTDAKGFKWYISEYGPEDPLNLLTIDMLWDFFNGKNQSGLNDEVRVILDSYGLLRQGSLTPDQDRVFKTVLLLEAISLRVPNVDLLRPNEQNVDLAFSGTDWVKGKARHIAIGLCEQGLLFEKPVGRGMKEYTAANRDSDIGKINKLKDEARMGLKTQDLIANDPLATVPELAVEIRQRFLIEKATAANFTQTCTRAAGKSRPNRFSMVVGFAMNDGEAAAVKQAIVKAINQPSNQLFFIECLTPMGNDLVNQYVENMAYRKNYLQNDKTRATHYEEQAKKCLTEWKDRILAGPFLLYTPEQKSGIRAANFDALQDELRRQNHQVYFCGLEQFHLNETMFLKNSLAQGAECGIRGELKGAYRSGNARTSLATALEGAWEEKGEYWNDPMKRSLPISRMKQRVEETIRENFEKPAGRVSMLAIYESLEDAPFGFLPCSVTAFVLGFLLKEYVRPDYFWSNGSTSERMTVEKMKQMIAEAVNQKFSPSPKYREEYIVSMSPQQRAFLTCTAAAFHIPAAQCGSVESARDQIRVKMKGLAFPIWCLKYTLEAAPLQTPAERITAVIDAYCGIANTANAGKTTESDLADQIGTLVQEHPAIPRDLEQLLTNEMCRKGMLAYIDRFRGGLLRQLANDIGDGGAYLDEVKKKFNADAANWVWGTETADEKISDVILEYQIIAESNRVLPKSITLRDTVLEWNKRSGNIRIPYDVLRKYVGELGDLLHQLYYMKQSGQLQEQYKQPFYDTLVAQRENFEAFYKNQLPCFNQAAGTFLEGLEETDIDAFFRQIPSGQFTKSSTEYYQYIEKKAEEYRRGIRKTQLKTLWRQKTGTDDPVAWSEQYGTPIFCMLEYAERLEAKKHFSAITASAPGNTEIAQAIAYLESAGFYDRLQDPEERDRCFMLRVVGDYAIMLPDAEKIRRDLRESVPEKVYDWMGNSAVQARLRLLAEKQYKLGGCERAQAVIDRMDPAELRRYLNDLIADNITVGIEILKNE